MLERMRGVIFSRRDQPPVISQQKKQTTPEFIVLRRSVFFIVIQLIVIEIVFDTSYILLRILPIALGVSSNLQGQLAPWYFIVLLFLNLCKLLFFLIIAMKWVTNIYLIGKGEIRHKSGVLGRNEKVYMCTHTQEVMYSQSLFGRICNFGSVEIFNPAIKDKIYLDGIPNPSKYTEMIKKNLPDTSTLTYIAMQQ